MPVNLQVLYNPAETQSGNHGVFQGSLASRFNPMM